MHRILLLGRRAINPLPAPLRSLTPYGTCLASFSILDRGGRERVSVTWPPYAIGLAPPLIDPKWVQLRRFVLTAEFQSKDRERNTANGEGEGGRRTLERRARYARKIPRSRFGISSGLSLRSTLALLHPGKPAGLIGLWLKVGEEAERPFPSLLARKANDSMHNTPKTWTAGRKRPF